MKTRVKKDTCIGCGACTTIANNIFTIGDDGLAETINPEEEETKTKNVSEEEIDNVIDATESCPVGAIDTTEE